MLLLWIVIDGPHRSILFVGGVLWCFWIMADLNSFLLYYFPYYAEELDLNVCELNVQHELELHNRYSDDLAK